MNGIPWSEEAGGAPSLMMRSTQPPPNCEFFVRQETGPKILCAEHTLVVLQNTRTSGFREPYRAPKVQDVQQPNGDSLIVPLEVSSVAGRVAGTVMMYVEFAFSSSSRRCSNISLMDGRC